jgi:hypothetical protein
MPYAVAFYNKRTKESTVMTHYGTHASNYLAKRAYVLEWNPIADTWAPKQVKYCFDAEKRSEGRLKIVKV